MDEIKVLDKIIRAFQKSFDKIESWGPQKKSIQEQLDIIKEFVKTQMSMAQSVKLIIKNLRPKEKERLKETNQNWVQFFTNNEKDIKIGLNDWEVLINKNSKIYH